MNTYWQVFFVCRKFISNLYFVIHMYIVMLILCDQLCAVECVKYVHVYCNVSLPGVWVCVRYSTDSCLLEIG